VLRELGGRSIVGTLWVSCVRGVYLMARRVKMKVRMRAIYHNSMRASSEGSRERYTEMGMK
jgi:hypothetical protein